MNLDSLKPAWQKFKLMNAVPPLHEQDIMSMLDTAEEMTISKTHRFLMQSCLFVVIMFCIQGG